MDFNAMLDKAKAWLLAGGWMWLMAGAAIVLVIAVPAALLWPTIQPKPTPQYQAIPSNAATATPATSAALPVAVPEEIQQEIADSLGEKNMAALSMSYQGDEKTIRVTRATSAMKFKTYTYVQTANGTWRQQ